MSLREDEAAAIRSFLEHHADLLRGEVLDYGSGRQPYRDIVERAGAVYHPYDSAGFPASTATGEDTGTVAYAPFDAVVCTQVLQYVPQPRLTVGVLHSLLKINGWLLMAGPTNWPIVEREDLWRFTPAGARALLWEAGFQDIQVSQRQAVNFEGERWCVGWAAIARA